MPQMSQVLRERVTDMLTAERTTRAVAREFNVHFLTIWENLAVRSTGLTSADHHHLMFQHDNAWTHVARICTQLLGAENVPVLPWPAYWPGMSPIEHVWDALDWQRVTVPANIQQLRTAFEEEWDNIPQSTAWSTMWRCVALHEANYGHTRYWLVSDRRPTF